jgi:hypothetical protein
MPVLREQDFDKLANQVVEQFLAGKTKLADAVAKLASDNGLNPDQIERLVQAANTQTFLRMMDQRKKEGAADLMHEFDPVDSKQVIRIVIDGAGVHILPPKGDAPSLGMEGPQDSDELPDEMHEAHEEAESEEEEEEEHEEEKKAPKKEATIFRARKMAALLEDQRKQGEWAFEDTFAKLAMSFKRAYNPTKYEAFEKDAMVEYGDIVGVAILDMLRGQRHLPPLEKTAVFEKVAALKDHHISDDTEELRLFETLHKIATKTEQLERSLAYVREQCA